ncbi:MAG: hypothetical protein JSS96_02740 [Bacteroidetes bacterium]|nr:hypothetical protein [Bacteroidota bacterium]
MTIKINGEINQHIVDVIIYPTDIPGVKMKKFEGLIIAENSALQALKNIGEFTMEKEGEIFHKCKCSETGKFSYKSIRA